VYDLATKKLNTIDFPEKACTVYPSGNSTFNTDVVRFSYTSLVSPQAVYDYNVATKQRVLKKQYDVPTFDAGKYESDWVYATAKDGTKVPISLMYKKGLKRDGSNPTLLYGYGSYGIPMDPSFSQTRISLLDRGFVFAIAHIRGGGENGRPWYDNGKLKKKKNTFTDFVNAAEYLIAEKFTNNTKLVIEGGSAGGLLMGAVVNMRPDLFKAVHAAVPFVDVINTMLDASLPLTTAEYVEWGNPNVKADYTYMKSYSPYDNVTKKAYPHLLLTTGINDTQVPYWEPAKWAAKLRALKTDDNILLLKTEMGVGHGGASGRYDALKDRAFEVAFFLKTLGIKE
jgi:oligopeptidase B